VREKDGILFPRCKNRMTILGLRISLEVWRIIHLYFNNFRQCKSNERCDNLTILIDTHLSENILRAFQFVQEDDVHVDHVVDVMRLRERSQLIASSERTNARGGEVHRYVLAAVLAEYLQSHRQQLAFLRTTEF